MMNTVEHKGYYGIIEYCNVDNLFFANVIGIGNSSISCHGDSLDDVFEEFKICIDDYLEVCALEGWEPNTTDPEVAREMEALMNVVERGGILAEGFKKQLAFAH